MNLIASKFMLFGFVEFIILLGIKWLEKIRKRFDQLNTLCCELATFLFHFNLELLMVVSDFVILIGFQLLF